MTPAAAGYPIAAVARLTGLSVDTLRAWERRYEAVTPIRQGRGRVYSERQVSRLKQLAGLVERGHAIGRIASLPASALRRLADEATPAAGTGGGADLEPLLTAIKRYELEAIDFHLSRLAVVLSPADFVLSVVVPALHEVGQRWENGSVRPAQEHLVSAVIRSVLGGMLRAMPRRQGTARAVFATPAGERHELGLLSAAVLAAAGGVEVIYLGPDLPAADLNHAVSRSGARALVLAATAAETIDRGDLQQLRKLPQGISVWAGGPAALTIKTLLGSRVVTVATLAELRQVVSRLAA